MPKSAAYVRYAMLSFERPLAARNEADWQAVRLAVIQTLDDHLHFVGRNMELEAGINQRPPLPYEVAMYLRDALNRAADGESDPLFKPKKIPGGAGNIAKAKRRVWIERAVDYLTVVDMGLSKDVGSRQRVAKSYGVDRRQVQRWIEQAGSLQRRQAALKKRYPQRAGMTRQFWEQKTSRLLREFVDFYPQLVGKKPSNRK